MKKQISDNWGFLILVLAIVLFCMAGAFASLGMVPWVASIAFMLNACILSGVIVRELEKPKFSSADDFHA